MKRSQYLKELNSIKLLELEEERLLWQRYKEEGDQAARAEIVEHYQPLVFKALSKWNLSEEVWLDTVQEGTLGLLEAVDGYDHLRGVAFSLYAIHRIRGRMIDFLKEEDQERGVSADELQLQGYNLLDRLVDAEPAIAVQAEANFLALQLQEAVARLPAKEQAVLSGVYLEDRMPQEMAELLEVSLSHVYRLQKQGVRRVRGMLSRLMQHW